MVGGGHGRAGATFSVVIVTLNAPSLKLTAPFRPFIPTIMDYLSGVGSLTADYRLALVPPPPPP